MSGGRCCRMAMSVEPTVAKGCSSSVSENGTSRPQPEPYEPPIRVKIYWANARGQVIHSPTSAYPDGFGGVRRHVSLAGPRVVLKVGHMAVRDLNELARTLADLRARQRDIAVVIDARQAVPFRWVVGALDACARASIGKVKFQSPPAPEGGGDDWWWL